MKKILTIIFMCFLSSLAFSQSDEIIDELYNEENAKTLYASLLVLQASGALTFDATIDDAREYMGNEKWGMSVLKDEEYITAGSFALLVMEAFSLPHGVIYNIFPIKRYALREMVYAGYFLGNPYPSNIISSFDVVYILASLPVKDEINKNYVDNSEAVSVE